MNTVDKAQGSPVDTKIKTSSLRGIGLGLFIKDKGPKAMAYSAGLSLGATIECIAPPNQMFTPWPSWVKSHKVEKIKKLKNFSAVYELILMGLPSIEVARQIQQLNEYMDQEVATIRAWVEHFKATVPRSMLMAKQVPIKRLVTQQTKMNRSIDIFQECVDLFFLQKQRVNIGWDREKELKFLLNGTNKEFKIALEYLKVLLEIKEAEGLTQSQLDQATSAPINHGYDFDTLYQRKGINKMMEDPASRMRIMKTVENVLESYSPHLDNKKRPPDLNMSPSNQVEPGPTLDDIPEGVNLMKDVVAEDPVEQPVQPPVIPKEDQEPEPPGSEKNAPVLAQRPTTNPSSMILPNPKAGQSIPAAQRRRPG